MGPTTHIIGWPRSGSSACERGPIRSHGAGGAGRLYCQLCVGLHFLQIASCSHRNSPVFVQTPPGSFERIRMSRSAPG